MTEHSLGDILSIAQQHRVSAGKEHHRHGDIAALGRAVYRWRTGGWTAQEVRVAVIGQVQGGSKRIAASVVADSRGGACPSKDAQERIGSTWRNYHVCGVGPATKAIGLHGYKVALGQ